MLDIHRLLERILELDASDLYLTVGSPPVFRVEGVATPTDEPKLSADDTVALAEAAMSDPRQREEFARTKEMNLALSVTGRGRFRCNIFQQRNSVGLVIRQIKLAVPSIDDLGLPDVLQDIALSRRGLVLVTGATGSGKSTTQAAMIDYRNATTPGHIVTIEDPIEFIHQHKKSIVTPATSKESKEGRQHHEKPAA